MPRTVCILMAAFALRTSESELGWRFVSFKLPAVHDRLMRDFEMFFGVLNDLVTGYFRKRLLTCMT